MILWISLIAVCARVSGEWELRGGARGAGKEEMRESGRAASQGGHPIFFCPSQLCFNGRWPGSGRWGDGEMGGERIEDRGAEERTGRWHALKTMEA
eukprot:689871-Hanusia_phi.AAC.1